MTTLLAMMANLAVQSTTYTLIHNAICSWTPEQCLVH